MDEDDKDRRGQDDGESGVQLGLALEGGGAQAQQAPPPDDEHEVGLSDAFIREILGLLDEHYTDRVQELCRDISAPDAAELLIKAGPEHRHMLVEILEDILPPDTFSYLDKGVLNELLRHMPPAQIASIVNELESDDALRMIDDLDAGRREDILRNLSRKVRAVIEAGLTFPEYTAGRLMQREFVAIPQFWTVGKTVDYMRAAADALPRKFYDIFIVDPMHKFVGAVELSRLLCAQRPVKVDTLVSEEHVTVPLAMDQEQLAFQFRRKDLLSAPVVDENNRLVGVVTVDDIVDVIDEEAEDDFLKMGGVTDSDINRSIVSTAWSRSAWLFVNLLTAFLASFVIGLFEDSIEKIVALAILMPIVASMGGNAGTQSLAVLIRALATKEVSAANAWRVVGKECMVGVLNGVIFAVVLGAAVVWWFGNPQLGVIISVALILNLFAAGLFGALIPVALARFGMDPAPGAGVVLTTVTDVVGFMAFLGLATWFLL